MFLYTWRIFSIFVLRDVFCMTDHILCIHIYIYILICGGIHIETNQIAFMLVFHVLDWYNDINPFATKNLKNLCVFRIFLRESFSFSLLTQVPLLHQNGRESRWEWAVLLSRKQIFITRRPRKSKEISLQSRAFISYTKGQRYTFDFIWGNPIVIHRGDTSA